MNKQNLLQLLLDHECDGGSWLLSYGYKQNLLQLLLDQEYPGCSVMDLSILTNTQLCHRIIKLKKVQGESEIEF